MGKTYLNLKEFNQTNKFFRNKNSQISQKRICKIPVKLDMLFYQCS